MNNLQTQRRLGTWQAALNQWTHERHKYAKNTKPYDLKTIAFLEGYLKDTYGSVLEVVIDFLKGNKNEQKDWPLIHYILRTAEIIEPAFESRLRTIAESITYSEIEHNRSKSDYLGYLLCSNALETPQQYANSLNEEIDIITNIMTKKYKTEKGSLLKPLVFDMLKNSKNTMDFESKQFVLLLALFKEPEYRQRFIPGKDSKDKTFRTRPTRFRHFFIGVLKPNMKRLRDGIFGGISEFIRETTSWYMLTD